MPATTASKTNPAPTELLSLREVAAEWRISRRMAYKLVSSGHLKAYRLGTRTIRVRREHAEAALRRIPTVADAKIAGGAA